MKKVSKVAKHTVHPKGVILYISKDSQEYIFFLNPKTKTRLCKRA